MYLPADRLHGVAAQDIITVARVAIHLLPMKDLRQTIIVLHPLCPVVVQVIPVEVVEDTQEDHVVVVVEAEDVVKPLF